MGCFNFIMQRLHFLLLMVYFQGSKSNLGSQYLTSFSFLEYSFNDASNRPCDRNESGSHKYCDLLIKLTVDCEKCLYAEREVYYPRKNSCYLNAQSLKVNDHKGLKLLSETTVVKLNMIVLDLDKNCMNAREIFRDTVNLTHNLIRKPSYLHIFDSMYGKFSVVQTMFCREHTCGKQCKFPVEATRCLTAVHQRCYYGYKDASCDDFFRHFVWMVTLLNFQTDYRKLKLDGSCYEEASAYFSVNGKNSSSKMIGSTNYQNPQFPIVLESKFDVHTLLYDYKLINESTVHFNLTTFCNGSKIASEELFSALIPVTKTGVFKFSKNGRLVFGVVDSCDDLKFGYVYCLSHYTSSTKKWLSLEPGRTAYSSAYETLCRYHECRNGGICMLRRTTVDVNAYSHNQIIDTDPEDYTAECKCPEEYSGLHCEVVRRSVLSSGEGQI